MVLGLGKHFGKSSRMQIAAGPFAPEFFKALKESSCMNCGTRINELALFGNALVVEPKKVVTKCLNCREGHVETLDRSVIKEQEQFKPDLDIDGVIFHVHQHRYSDSGELMEWLYVLLKLRQNYAYFQSSSNTAEGFRTVWEKSEYIYGHLLGIGSCGECGAVWRDYSEGTGKEIKGWNSEVCWSCGLPHEMQWHMRISGEEEMKILLGK